VAADQLTVVGNGTTGPSGTINGPLFTPYAIGRISVKEPPYNAVGDGVTDDRVAITAAFTAAKAMIAAGFAGAEVFFPPGVYIVSRTGVQAFSLILSLATNITLSGIRGLSWIKHPTGLPAASISVLELDCGSTITIRDLGFDGNWGNAITSIAQASNGLTLPQPVINVLDTTGFPASGSMTVLSTAGSEIVNYTGVTPTSFTGCTGGTGTIMRNYAVIYVNAHTGINQADQGDPQNFLIFNRGVTNLLIEGCLFQQCYGDFIWNGGSNLDHTVWARDVRIVNCDGNITARNAVTVGSATVGLVVDRCKWTNVFQCAMDSEPQGYPSRDVTVQNSYLDRWPDPTHAIGGVVMAMFGADLNGYALPASAATNWRVIDNVMNGSVISNYAQDVRIAGNHFTLDWPSTSKSAIQVMLGSGDITIVDNFVYIRTSVIGVDDSGKAGIDVYDYETPGASGGTARFNPPNVQIRGNKIHARNGRVGINLVAPGAIVDTFSGVATSVTDLTVVQTGAGWTADQFAGCVVRIGTSEMAVATNTTDTITGNLVDNSFTSGWQTDAGQYAPTPTGTPAFVVFRITGVCDVSGNDIDMRDDGNGNGSFGIQLTNVNASHLIGQRTRVKGNKIKCANPSGIKVIWPLAGAMPLVDISDNFGNDDQPTPTMTNLIEYAGTPLVSNWIMSNNTIGEGVTNIVAGLGGVGTWLVNNGNVQAWAGFGSPETVVTAPVGSIFQRLDGGAATSFYVKVSGTGATGWAGSATTGTFATVTNAGSPYTVLTSDSTIFVDTSGGPVVLTLPAPATQSPTGPLRVIDTKGTFNTNNCTLAQNAAEKIGGLAASKNLQTNWGFFTVATNLVDWFVD
jgi:hypothetical protein